jgi:hypothetical protein
MTGTGLLDDTVLMKCLRRVNSDTFWSKDSTTVSQNLGKVNISLQSVHEIVVLNPPVSKMGPWKLVDEFGAGVMAIMANYSLNPGVT